MRIIFAGLTTQKVNKWILNISLKRQGRLKEIAGKRKLTVGTVTAVNYIKDWRKEMRYNLKCSKEDNKLKMQQGR